MIISGLGSFNIVPPLADPVTSPKVLQLYQAEGRGYNVFICPGGSMIARIIHKHKPKAVLGVACIKEIIMAAEELDMKRRPYQAVELLKAGCVSTDVELEHVFRVL